LRRNADGALSPFPDSFRVFENETKNGKQNMTKDIGKSVSDSSDSSGNGDENLPVNEPAFNFYEAYGAQAAQRNIIGKLLKFTKGDYCFGPESTLFEEGTRMIVDMESLLVGWQRWENNAPTDSHMGPIVEGFQPPKRRELGDLDDTAWEVDESTGRPRDPWQYTNQVVMRELGTKGEENGLYTFTTASRGGINAVGILCKTYGKQIRTNPGIYPIVELNTDSYMHSNKQYGRIKVPVLDVVGWATVADIDDATETEVGVIDEPDGDVLQKQQTASPRQIAPKKPATTAAAAKKAVAAKKKTRF